MEGDNNQNLAPSSRTLTPGPLESLKVAPEATNGHDTITTLPADDQRQGKSIHALSLDDPPKSAVSASSSKSVTFAEPFESYPEHRYYSRLPSNDTEDPTMVDPYSTENQRRSVSNQHNIPVDFKLNTRRRSTEHPLTKAQKLVKGRSSPFTPTSPAFPSASSDDGGALTPQRSISSSSNKSLRNHFTFLRIPKRSSQPPPTPLPAPEDLTDLPANRSLLEGRINYHIGRLDRLRHRLRDVNVAIRQEVAETESTMAYLVGKGMDASVHDLRQQLASLRGYRDGLRPSVAFHRGELVRIGRKRMQVDEDEGYDARLPAVYENLEGDEAWEQRFVV